MLLQVLSRAMALTRNAIWVVVQAWEFAVNLSTLVLVAWYVLTSVVWPPLLMPMVPTKHVTKLMAAASAPAANTFPWSMSVRRTPFAFQRFCAKANFLMQIATSSLTQKE